MSLVTLGRANFLRFCPCLYYNAVSVSYTHLSNFDKFVYYLLAMATGICMTMFYMYDQRTALAQLVISSMVVILAFFPNRNKITLTIFGFGGAVLVGLVFATGSMGYEVGKSNEGMLAELSKMAELYVSGPSMVAITQQEYSWVRGNMSFMTYISDFINTSHVSVSYTHLDVYKRQQYLQPVSRRI